MSPGRRLFAYVWRYRGRLGFGLFCSIVTTAISLTAPLILQWAIDDLALEVTSDKLVIYGGWLLAAGVAGGFFRFWTRRVIIGVSRDIEYDLRNDFYAHLQTLPLSYYQANRTGDLMSRATNDLGAVRMMVGPAVMYSSNTVLTFVAALSMMMAIDVRLTLIALIPLPFVSISVKMFGSAIHQGFERLQAQLSEVSAIAQEALSGVRIVRAYRQESAELGRFERANREYLRRSRRLIALQGFFFPTMSLFLGLGAMLVLWLGSGDVIRGRITLGEFVAFFAYLTMLSWPMIAFGWVTNMLQRGMASWKRMLEVLETAPAIRDPAASGDASRSLVDAPAARIRNGEIEFRHLSFAYGETMVLHDITAHVPAGSTTAIVGATGSGKSTLVSLIMRLHDPAPGTLFIDGVDVRTIPLAELRRAIGVVPQEPFLFSDTIGDNIAFGVDGQSPGADTAAATPASLDSRQIASDLIRATSGVSLSLSQQQHEDRRARIETAAALARLDKDLPGFPKGYDTMVGERGITLSGGQKQRAAIARAVAIDPTILILDDALSAVDTHTEEEILERLDTVFASRTTIIVAHRISTVRRADQILVLDGGRIVERGTHESLLVENGLYADLHRHQLLEEELAAS